jgi:hypothetical protein
LNDKGVYGFNKTFPKLTSFVKICIFEPRTFTDPFCMEDETRVPDDDENHI